MITIYDNKLFAELEKKPEWNTLFDNDYNPKNPNIPVLAGGLDHISKTKNFFVFHDIGCNGRDNSFRISRKVEDFSNGTDIPDLREADLSGLDLRGLYLRWADLRGADLQGADLRGADLQDANLQGADLRGANLQDANLRYADLQEADLRGADLQDANLQRTDLQDANLRDADLRGANLRDADLRGANLRDADLDYCGYELSCKTIGIIADSRLVSQLLYHLCQMDVQACPEWDELRNDERVIALANQAHVIREHGLPEIEPQAQEGNS